MIDMITNASASTLALGALGTVAAVMWTGGILNSMRHAVTTSALAQKSKYTAYTTTFLSFAGPVAAWRYGIPALVAFCGFAAPWTLYTATFIPSALSSIKQYFFGAKTTPQVDKVLENVIGMINSNQFQGDNLVFKCKVEKVTEDKGRVAQEAAFEQQELSVNAILSALRNNQIAMNALKQLEVFKYSASLNDDIAGTISLDGNPLKDAATTPQLKVLAVVAKVLADLGEFKPIAISNEATTMTAPSYSLTVNAKGLGDAVQAVLREAGELAAKGAASKGK